MNYSNILENNYIFCFDFFKTTFGKKFKAIFLNKYKSCYLDKVTIFSLFCFEIDKETLSYTLKKSYIKLLYSEIAIICESTFYEIINMTYILNKYCDDEIYIKKALKYLNSISSNSREFICLVDLISNISKNKFYEKLQKQILNNATLKAINSFDFLLLSLIYEKFNDRISANFYMEKGFELLKISNIAEISKIINDITVYSNDKYDFFRIGWYNQFYNELINIKIYHKDFEDFKNKRGFHSKFLVNIDLI